MWTTAGRSGHGLCLQVSLVSRGKWRSRKQATCRREALTPAAGLGTQAGRAGQPAAQGVAVQAADTSRASSAAWHRALSPPVTSRASKGWPHLCGYDHRRGGPSGPVRACLGASAASFVEPPPSARAFLET